MFGLKQIERILAYFHPLLPAVKLTDDSYENTATRQFYASGVKLLSLFFIRGGPSPQPNSALFSKRPGP
jgi:hypothetical protein